MGVKINGFLKFFFYLFSFISYLSEALFEPLLAPKQHLTVTAVERKLRNGCFGSSLLASN
jgi:hypothetical protein